MSHHSRLATRIVSARHLCAALEDLGLSTFEVHAEPQPLNGWTGGTTDFAAQIILRRETHAGAADVGFVRRADGTFEALVTEMDRVHFGAAWQRRLARRYAFHVATSMLAEQGFDLVEQEDETDGSVRLTLRRTA